MPNSPMVFDVCPTQWFLQGTTERDRRKERRVRSKQQKFSRGSERCKLENSLEGARQKRFCCIATRVRPIAPSLLRGIQFWLPGWPPAWHFTIQLRRKEATIDRSCQFQDRKLLRLCKQAMLPVYERYPCASRQWRECPQPPLAYIHIASAEE